MVVLCSAVVVQKAVRDLPRNLLFSKKNRLNSEAAFQHVFEAPSKLSRKHWLVLYRPNELGYPRLGVIVAKKTYPKATDRNTAKRIARESFRQVLPEIKSFDIIVLARAGREMTSEHRQVLRKELDGLWPCE
jgi:ribonuclease P protein component